MKHRSPDQYQDIYMIHKTTLFINTLNVIISVKT